MTKKHAQELEFWKQELKKLDEERLELVGEIQTLQVALEA